MMVCIHTYVHRTCKEFIMLYVHYACCCCQHIHTYQCTHTFGCPDQNKLCSIEFPMFLSCFDLDILMMHDEHMYILSQLHVFIN
jgi:hypothetical protein